MRDYVRQTCQVYPSVRLKCDRVFRRKSLDIDEQRAVEGFIVRRRSERNAESRRLPRGDSGWQDPDPDTRATCFNSFDDYWPCAGHPAETMRSWASGP